MFAPTAAANGKLFHLFREKLGSLLHPINTYRIQSSHFHRLTEVQNAEELGNLISTMKTG